MEKNQEKITKIDNVKQSGIYYVHSLFYNEKKLYKFNKTFKNPLC